MDDIRKKAYKTLNYQVLLDNKNSGFYSEEKFNQIFRMAHVFHNLAEFIIEDFEEFDEDRFWREISGLEKAFGLNHYRKIFSEVVSQ